MKTLQIFLVKTGTTLVSRINYFYRSVKIKLWFLLCIRHVAQSAINTVSCSKKKKKGHINTLLDCYPVWVCFFIQANHILLLFTSNSLNFFQKNEFDYTNTILYNWPFFLRGQRKHGTVLLPQKLELCC